MTTAGKAAPEPIAVRQYSGVVRGECLHMHRWHQVALIGGDSGQSDELRHRTPSDKTDAFCHGVGALWLPFQYR